VFYCSLGHGAPVYSNSVVLQHDLAGIRYALGDLNADSTPSAKPAR
jgi:type 1 glutamine amidotransferase